MLDQAQLAWQKLNMICRFRNRISKFILESGSNM
jgi:hypothetical protein